jgi:hypothetical protein
MINAGGLQKTHIIKTVFKRSSNFSGDRAHYEKWITTCFWLVWIEMLWRCMRAHTQQRTMAQLQRRWVRAHHGTTSYSNDSKEVWSYMVNITRSRDWSTYVKSALYTKEDRQDLLLLCGHFHGPDHVASMDSIAEAILVSVSYTWEINNWT